MTVFMLIYRQCSGKFGFSYKNRLLYAVVGEEHFETERLMQCITESISTETPVFFDKVSFLKCTGTNEYVSKQFEQNI